MARRLLFSTLWATSLIASVVLASLLTGAPVTLIGPTIPATALQTEDTGTIVATVTDDAGRPIADAVLAVAYTSFTNTTDETGVAVIYDLPVDPTLGTYYLVYAEKDGYVSSGLVEVYLNLTSNPAEEVGLEISGGILYGVVEDAVGPVPDAIVTIVDLEYSNITDADGVYSIRGVPGRVANYLVTATAAGYNSEDDYIHMDVDDFVVLDFVLTSLTGMISGTVTHATTGEELYNASVSVRLGTDTWTKYTDVDGKYAFDLQPGLYTVTAAMDGFDSATLSDVQVVSGVETSGVDFQLTEKPTKLYGIVRSGTFLVPGVLISVEGTEFTAESSVDGYYEILNITAGTYTLTASLEGYNTVTVIGVVVARGGETQVNINMTSLPGPSLSGMVFSTSTNSALPGVAVIVLGEGVQRSTVTNTEGQFVVPGLMAGNYTVRFYLEGYKPLELTPVSVPETGLDLGDVTMMPVPESFGGFIFGFDLAHSMMILALLLTIVILALAVMLRVKAFEAPDKAPAVYDAEGEESAEDKKAQSGPDRERKKKDKKRK